MSWQFSWKLGLIGLLLVFTYIPYLFIYLFIYLFLYLLLFLSHLFSLCFQLLFYLFTICISILLSHYAPHLLLPRLQYHYFLNIFVFISYKLIVFLIAI